MPLISILILHRHLCWWIGDAFRHALILILCLIPEFSVEITCKRGISFDQLSDGLLIAINLIFKKFAVSHINVELKLIYFKTPHHTSLNVAKQIGHFVNTVLVFHIDEISLSWLPAVLALSGILCLHGKANLTKDAVAIKNETTNGFEASLALVTVQLHILVHLYYIRLSIVKLI